MNVYISYGLALYVIPTELANYTGTGWTNHKITNLAACFIWANNRTSCSYIPRITCIPICNTHCSAVDVMQRPTAAIFESSTYTYNGDKDDGSDSLFGEMVVTYIRGIKKVSGSSRLLLSVGPYKEQVLSKASTITFCVLTQ